MRICSGFASTLIAWCAGALTASAQESYSCRIIGSAPGAQGREIVWKADKDMFSEEAVELGRARIGADGKFVLTTGEISETTPTFFCIDYYHAGLVAEVRKTYYLRLDSSFDYFADETINAFVASNRLPELRYVLTDSLGGRDTTDLNYYLGKYAYHYGRMLAKNFENIRIRRDTAPVGAFMRFSSLMFSSVANPYFQTYRTYSEALLEAFSGMKSRKELFDAYIDGRPFSEANPAQRDFYRNYFLDYFINNRFLPFNQTRRIIQGGEATAGERVRALTDSMGLDYAVRNERLRERVLLYGLQQLWVDERIESAAITALVRYMAENAKFGENRISASLMLEERRERYMRRYFTGIDLADGAGTAVRIDSLLVSGLFHYFVFVRAEHNTCPDCAAELDRLRTVWEKSSSEVRAAVRVYLINCDYTHARYVHDARKNAWPWPYFHFNGNIDWVRKIDASRFPAYFLVDDKGGILDSQFSAPSGDLEMLFKKMAKMKKDREEAALQD